MYDLKYVKKRKRRIWVAVCGGIASVVLSTFIIIAFLGRFVGTFTVSLNTGNVELSLSDSIEYKNKDTYLRIDSIPTFHEFTYSSLPSDADLDSEAHNYLYGAIIDDDSGEAKSLNYFKYTFFVKNTGRINAKYSLKINITDNKAGEGGRTLDDTLRVMLFDNNGIDNDAHEKVVYAKKAAVHRIDEDGNANFQEPISVSEEDATESEPFMGYAEQFESPNVVTTLVVSNFKPDEVRRYTIVNWLEGYDPQSNNYSAPPKGARIKLGVEINAYEN